MLRKTFVLAIQWGYESWYKYNIWIRKHRYGNIGIHKGLCSTSHVVVETFRSWKRTLLQQLSTPHRAGIMSLWGDKESGSSLAEGSEAVGDKYRMRDCVNIDGRKEWSAPCSGSEAWFRLTPSLREDACETKHGLASTFLKPTLENTKHPRDETSSCPQERAIAEKKPKRQGPHVHAKVDLDSPWDPGIIGSVLPRFDQAMQNNEMQACLMNFPEEAGGTTGAYEDRTAPGSNAVPRSLWPSVVSVLHLLEYVDQQFADIARLLFASLLLLYGQCEPIKVHNGSWHVSLTVGVQTKHAKSTKSCRVAFTNVLMQFYGKNYSRVCERHLCPTQAASPKDGHRTICLHNLEALLNDISTGRAINLETCKNSIRTDIERLETWARALCEMYDAEASQKLASVRVERDEDGALVRTIDFDEGTTELNEGTIELDEGDDLGFLRTINNLVSPRMNILVSRSQETEKGRTHAETCRNELFLVYGICFPSLRETIDRITARQVQKQQVVRPV
jgi:hypothetical protein